MSQPTQQITVNDESRDVPSPLTVAGLIEYLGVDRKHVAVERNRVLVTQANQAAVPIEPGDVIEIVTFVGGG